MRYAWKELGFYKKKYLLIELLIILMMFMVVFLSGLANGLGRAVSAVIEKSPATHYIVKDSAEQIITFSALTEEDEKTIDGLNLSNATGITIQRTGLLPKGADEKVDMSFFVVDPTSFMAPAATEGKNLSAKKNALLLNDTLKAKGIKVGDELTDEATDMTFEVIGFTHDAMYGHGPVAFISQETYTRLQEKLNPKYQYHPQAIAFNDKHLSEKTVDQVEIVSKKNIISHIPGYSAEQSTLNMILWVLVLASAAILGVFFYIITLQKHHEFSVMKAIGMKMSEIARFQLAQVTLLALIGIIIGDGLAFGLSKVLPVSMPFFLKVPNVLLVSGAFLIIALLSSVLSILKVAKIDPIEVINGGAE